MMTPLESEQPERPKKTPLQVRLRAAIFVVPFGLIAAWYFRHLLGDREGTFVKHGYHAAGPLVPLVYFGTELLFGRTVPDLSKSWDALAGWQRGALGCGLVTVLCFILMVVLFTVYGVW